MYPGKIPKFNCWIPAAIAAGAMLYEGQQNRNAASSAAAGGRAYDYKKFREGNKFNAEQAQITRDTQARFIEDQQMFAGQEAEKGRMWSANQAGISRDWQEKMDNTVVQRRMADMKKAGINPLLAAGKVSGGSPGGAMASSSPASSPSGPSPAQASATSAGSSIVDRSAEVAQRSIEAAVSSAIGATKAVTERRRQQQDQARSEQLILESRQKQKAIAWGMVATKQGIRVSKEKVKLLAAQTVTEWTKGLKNIAEESLTKKQWFKIQSEIEVIKQNIKANESIKDLQKKQAEMDKAWLKIDQILKRFLPWYKGTNLKIRK